MHIRPATQAVAAAISALVMSVAPSFTLRPDGKGAEVFFATLTPETFGGYLASPDYAYRVAEGDGALAGVVGMRGNRHLFHLRGVVNGKDADTATIRVLSTQVQP